MEPVDTLGDRFFINDSLATTVESATAALQSFDQPVVAICGGSDKGQDVGELVESLARNARMVACIGHTGPELARRLTAANVSRPSVLEQVQVFQEFEAAMLWVCHHSQEGEVILLSPGFASYDWFPNFEARGEAFRKLAHQLKPG